MSQLTKEEQDQKLLDIAFEPDCNCEAVMMKQASVSDHWEFCAWRGWRERMNCYEVDDVSR